jgi:hypothetical protein
MSRKKTPEPEVHVHNPAKQKGTLKTIAASMSDDSGRSSLQATV